MAHELEERVEELFHRALECEPDTRRAFVEGESARDPVVAHEVLSLLAAHDTNPAFLLRSPVESARPLPDQIGRRIGSWRIVRELGQGGMGAVYLALRDDGAFEQEGALKLIRHEGTSEARRELVARFLLERQHLAHLSHPHIAALIDGGATEDGTPYLVMEYIEGAPIDRYCREHELTLDARLTLFVAVCRAVQFAHSRLVAHRDLKPSNILVKPGTSANEPPIPKLLDFGIAKLIGAPDENPLRTTLGSQRLTPAYASPEQFLGRPATVATDVYALGVVLHELLTGALPYELEGKAPHEIARIVCEQAPARAGASVPALRGDLETIVLHALEKDPLRRYPSAAALAEDVERYLSGRPILAHPASTSYRLRKAIARHKLPFALGALLLVLMIGSTIWLALLTTRALSAESLAETRRGEAQRSLENAQARTKEAEQARAESDKARAESEKARTDAETARAESEQRRKLVERTSALFSSLFGSADPESALGKDVTVAAALDDAVPRVIESLAGEPELSASIQEMAGATYRNLGRLARSEELLQSAVAGFRKTRGADDPLTLRAEGQLGITLVRLGRIDEAVELGRGNVARCIARLGDDDSMTLAAQGLLGMFLREQGQLPEAEELQRNVHEAQVRLLGAGSADALNTLNNLASLLMDQQRFAEAEELLRVAVDGRKKLYANDHPQVLLSENNLALALSNQGKLAEAKTWMEEILPLCRARLGEEHPQTLSLRANLAALRMRTGQLEEAERDLRELLEVQARAVGENHPERIQQRYNLAMVINARGRIEEACALLAEIVPQAEASLPKGHWKVALYRSSYGRSLAHGKRFDEAEPELERALAGLEGTLGNSHPQTREIRDAFARMYESWGKPEKAAAVRARGAASGN